MRSIGPDQQRLVGGNNDLLVGRALNTPGWRRRRLAQRRGRRLAVRRRGNDWLSGGDGRNCCSRDSDDLLFGDAGDAALLGGDGDDVLINGSGDDS